jgi:hypothetical protein
MSVSRLASAELVVHIFAPAEGPDAPQCYEELRSLWDKVRLELSLETEIPGLGIGGELPAGLDTIAPGAVAARAGDHPDGFYQALFRRSHDVLILSAALAPRDVAAGTWIELQRQWAAVARTPDAAYGAVQVFQGLIRNGQVMHSELRTLAHSLAPLVPGGRTEPPWQDHGCIADDGLAVWETGSLADGRRERQLVVIGPPGKDALLSAWTWSSGDASTTPLTRYLMHAAKLRYEYRVWEESRAGVQSRRNQVSAETAAVLEQVSSADRDVPFDADTVSKLLEPCYALEADIAVLVDIGSQIRQLKRTVEIAVANLSECVHLPAPRGRPTMFADDQKLGTWLTAQLDDDATYIMATREGARDVVTAARGALERRSAALEEAESEHRDKISLLQAVIISAAVLCLTAVQTLGYHLPLREGVRPAVVTALSACALWFVVVVTRLAARPHSTSRTARQAGWLGIECLVAGLALSAVCWAISSWARLQLLHYPPSATITWTSSAAGFVVGAFAVLIRSRRADGR